MDFPEPNLYWLKELCYFNDKDLHGRIHEAPHIWGSGKSLKTRAKDLVALREPQDIDRFSKFLVEDVMQWLHQHILWRFSRTMREENPLIEYEYLTWMRCTNMITAVIACLLPVLFISVLSSIQSMRWRLTAIACFNILSTICLNVFTTAKRVEIFAVTAA
jgi:hypothetical protein